MEKIAFYGGSFDPPHKGHRVLSQNLLKASGAEKLIIMPAYSSPFKNGAVADENSRLEMCRLNFSGDNIAVSDFEINRPQKSYTADTLSHIKELYPDSIIYLFMGNDMFLSLADWHNSKKLLSMCVPVCAARTGDKTLIEKMKHYAENTLGLNGDDYIISEEPPFAVSSTEIRKRISENKDVSTLLTKEVYEYIIKRGLYRNEQG